VKIEGIKFTVDNFSDLRIKMLNWANRFNIFCLLDNQQYHFQEPTFECLLAVGCKKKLSVNAGKAFSALKDFYAAEKGWLFGHFGYDLKNETENLTSKNFDGIGFDDLHFFVPEIVVQFSQSELIIHCDGDAATIFNDIIAGPATIYPLVQTNATIKNRISKEDYLSTIKKIQAHILRGDCYEINFCQEFFADNAAIDPIYIYQQLTTISPNPFSVLYKLHDKYCICASPERYLKKTGNKITSQPIKGTVKRNLTDAAADETGKAYLLKNEKEKSENVMVVDLVRNDLSRVCRKGSVKVEELFGIYSFPQVHQMISTISGELPKGINWVDVIRETFPMGSMTGAPKKRVMELIERYEQTKRGLFSGAIGYIDPAGDFDFNVVIRSLLYNSTAGYLSFQAGGAITFYSDAEKEYDESVLKAGAILKALQ